MADHPLISAATAEAGLVADTLLDAFVKRMPLTIGPTEDLVDTVQSIGSPPLSILSAATGQVYFYDETDSTTPDDGVTCLVDGLGRRYKVSDAASIEVSSILAISDTPPVSPSLGDAYVVDVAPTGAWAANAKDIAIYTQRGWVFATPQVGTTLLNKDTDLNIQYLAAGTWGAFAFSDVTLADGSVHPRSLLKAAGIAVESTENTPPGAPAANTFWLVGDTPTGDFSGHEDDIAFYASSAWAFIDAYEGATVFNKDLGFEVSYISGAWLGGAGSSIQEFSTSGGPFTWTKPAGGNVALIECWGAGGSGGRAGSSDYGGGGGGGAYRSRIVKMSDLASTVAVTVGAGGTAQTSDNQDGVAGGNSSFGSHVTAYGGGGGAGNVSFSGGGGGGGGQMSAGASVAGAAAVSTAGGAGGQSMIAASPSGGATGSPPTVGGNGSDGSGGGGGGSSSGGSAGAAGGSSADGGGGGGGGSGTGGLAGGAGGKSGHGGGGGGGAHSGGGSTGGTSVEGGNGGAGSTSTTAATAGSQPGGGGGGSESGNSGKGGDGLVRVTVW